jgi:hypothetical protein
MLVDDGVDVVFSRTLFEKLSNFDFLGFASQLLENIGRFRPIYWMYHMTVWLIGRNSYQFQHFAHMLVIGLTIFFIYLIIRKLTKSRVTSFFGALAYLLIPLNTENILRLGPQEPLMVLFLSALFYFLIENKKIFLQCLVLVLSVFTKETSIALLPILFFYYIYGKNSKLVENKKQGFYLWITICISSLLLILITFLLRSGYSTNYFFNLQILIGNLSFYFIELSKNTLFIFPLAVIIYSVRIGVALIRKQNIFDSKSDLFEFLFFMGFLCFLSIQLPWRYAINRYLMPADFFLIMFLSIEMYKDFKLFGNFKFIYSHKHLFDFLLILIGIYTSLIWGLQIIYRETSTVSYYEAFRKIAGFSKNTTLLVNMPEGENTIEYFDEIQIQLSEFWKRPDIRIEYLDLQNIPKGNYIIVSSDQLPKRYPQDKLNSSFKNTPMTILNTSRGLTITTPPELIKQSMKKLINFLVYKKQFTSNGLYTYYYNYNNWYFYHE